MRNASPYLPGTGRGTIRRMVEGSRVLNFALRVTASSLPLHHRVAAVPLPVPGRYYA